ncbi:MAG: phage antirepressor [Clostridia bacterium]
MNEIIKINNVRGCQTANGMAQLNLEDVARGLGFTNVATSGHEVVRWARVRKYLNDIGFNIKNEKLPEYIPENIFYKLCFKAKNEVARRFQDMVTDEVLPSIRKHGAYLTPDKVEEVLLNPDTIINLATELKKERLLNEQNQKLIGELKPKADYTDMVLQSKGTVTINAIANDYGMTAIAMNRLLYSLGVQYKQGEQWLLYGKYRNFGYTHNKTIHYHHKNGTPATKLNMEWTQKGRLFLYRLLKEHDILPLIEELSA